MQRVGHASTSVRQPHPYRALSTVSRTKVSIAIVGRPSLNTGRPIMPLLELLREVHRRGDGDRCTAAAPASGSLVAEHQERER